MNWRYVVLGAVLMAVVIIGVKGLLALAEHTVERIALDIVCRSLVEANLVGRCGQK